MSAMYAHDESKKRKAKVVSGVRVKICVPCRNLLKKYNKTNTSAHLARLVLPFHIQEILWNGTQEQRGAKYAGLLSWIVISIRTSWTGCLTLHLKFSGRSLIIQRSRIHIIFLHKALISNYFQFNVIQRYNVLDFKSLQPFSKTFQIKLSLIVPQSMIKIKE